MRDSLHLRRILHQETWPLTAWVPVCRSGRFVGCSPHGRERSPRWRRFLRREQETPRAADGVSSRGRLFGWHPLQQAQLQEGGFLYIPLETCCSLEACLLHDATLSRTKALPRSSLGLDHRHCSPAWSLPLLPTPSLPRSPLPAPFSASATQPRGSSAGGQRRQGRGVLSVYVLPRYHPGA